MRALSVQLVVIAVFFGAAGTEARQLKQSSGGVQISANISSFVDGDKVQVFPAVPTGGAGESLTGSARGNLLSQQTPLLPKHLCHRPVGTQLRLFDLPLVHLCRLSILSLFHSWKCLAEHTGELVGGAAAD